METLLADGVTPSTLSLKMNGRKSHTANLLFHQKGLSYFMMDLPPLDIQRL